jgi:hypothetical protein
VRAGRRRRTRGSSGSKGTRDTAVRSSTAPQERGRERAQQYEHSKHRSTARTGATVSSLGLNSVMCVLEYCHDYHLFVLLDLLLETSDVGEGLSGGGPDTPLSFAPEKDTETTRQRRERQGETERQRKRDRQRRRERQTDTELHGDLQSRHHGVHQRERDYKQA